MPALVGLPELKCACAQERSGSSLAAISKAIGEKHPGLPGPWKKTLSYQIRKLGEQGKLVKVRPVVNRCWGCAKPLVCGAPRPPLARPWPTEASQGPQGLLESGLGACQGRERPGLGTKCLTSTALERRTRLGPLWPGLPAINGPERPIAKPIDLSGRLCCHFRARGAA